MTLTISEIGLLPNGTKVKFREKVVEPANYPTPMITCAELGDTGVVVGTEKDTHYIVESDVWHGRFLTTPDTFDVIT